VSKPATGFNAYLQLAKPGIVFGNWIAATGGFLLAARGEVDWALLGLTMLGVSLVVASGCVFNNIIDQDIDRVMRRTRNRALVTGAVTPAAAWAYGTLLGCAGFGVLAGWTNWLCLGLAALGWVVYVGVYSLWLKRCSVHSTVVGSLAGAAPPVIGYCAVSGRLDAAAWLLLAIFGLWQIPHSYAIAIFRLDDFVAARLPVLPVARGVAAAKRQIVVSILAFAVAAPAMTLAGYTGVAYFAVAGATGGYWLWVAMAERGGDDAAWARRIFACSIFAVMALAVMMSADFRAAAVLPIGGGKL
jgi:heme o synthase